MITAKTLHIPELGKRETAILDYEIKGQREGSTLRPWQGFIALGVPVEAGDLLGTLSDVWGSGVTEIRPSEAGTPLFLTTNPAASFDGELLGIALD